jgi:hypothetical protein
MSSVSPNGNRSLGYYIAFVKTKRIGLEITFLYMFPSLGFALLSRHCMTNFTVAQDKADNTQVFFFRISTAQRDKPADMEPLIRI